NPVRRLSFLKFQDVVCPAPIEKLHLGRFTYFVHFKGVDRGSPRWSECVKWQVSNPRTRIDDSTSSICRTRFLRVSSGHELERSIHVYQGIAHRLEVLDRDRWIKLRFVEPDQNVIVIDHLAAPVIHSQNVKTKLSLEYLGNLADRYPRSDGSKLGHELAQPPPGVAASISSRG